MTVKMDMVRFKKNGREYERMINDQLDDVAADAADMVLAETKRLVPVDTGTLRDEIRVSRGRFRKGDYHIEAQGRGGYKRFYATFVEFGSMIHPHGNPDAYKHLPAQPFLRPALIKLKPRISRMVQRALD